MLSPSARNRVYRPRPRSVSRTSTRIFSRSLFPLPSALYLKGGLADYAIMLSICCLAPSVAGLTGFGSLVSHRESAVRVNKPLSCISDDASSMPFDYGVFISRYSCRKNDLVSGCLTLLKSIRNTISLQMLFHVTYDITTRRKIDFGLNCKIFEPKASSDRHTPGCP